MVGEDDLLRIELTCKNLKVKEAKQASDFGLNLGGCCLEEREVREIRDRKIEKLLC